jgi:hypothetical protein
LKHRGVKPLIKLDEEQKILISALRTFLQPAYNTFSPCPNTVFRNSFGIRNVCYGTYREEAGVGNGSLRRNRLYEYSVFKVCDDKRHLTTLLP